MRANLVEREPRRLAHWEKTALAKRRLDKNASGKAFILHDGPPFTNGDVHIGTALNKILKDIIVRFQSMRGRYAPYLPGWDCHGLPIEHKVAREMKDEGRELSAPAMRKACEKFARNFMAVQREQFKRLGVLADWQREYRTLDPAYEAKILETLAAMVDAGLVYRSKKPVYWSIPCATALAEAEIEYQEHRSPAIHVAFPVLHSPAMLPQNATLVIWTTTPWTLPANLAIAVNPELFYDVLQDGNDAFVVASALSDAFRESTGKQEAQTLATLKGSELLGTRTRHPFIERESPVFGANFVTAEAGTGCVHIAPGHGLDDYLLGREHGLEIYCPLDDAGCYLDDGQIPATLVGASVLETDKGSEANRRVLNLLKDSGHLLAKHSHLHSYPHCWRSKTPVVFRAMDQWFVSLEASGLKQKALEAIGGVRWDPPWGENRIRAAVGNRPDWCISRQRTWGVPLPAFYNADGEPLLDGAVIRGIAAKVAKHGTNYWFENDASTLLEGIALPEGWQSAGLQKGSDTLDVWIDSGCSHRAVLQGTEDLHWPADLYIEGSDQHRGWFQSSLWTGIIADGAAPYREVLTHGFIVGQDGRKISKSDGKPQGASDYINQFGADVIRLWIASEDFRNDIPVSNEIIENVAQTYRNIRNSLRFQAGNLYDFDAARDAVVLEQLDGLDVWALAQTQIMLAAVTDAYSRCEFHRVYQLVSRFCSQQLSSTYHDILKDRLYTLAADDPQRRSSQTVLQQIFLLLCRILHPILPFTTDEAYSFYTANSEYTEDSVYLLDWPEANTALADDPRAQAVEKILTFKSDLVNDALEKARQAKVIAASTEAKVSITLPAGHPLADVLRSHADALPELLIVSQVFLHEAADGSEPVVQAEHADGVRCPRTWRWVPHLVTTETWGPVSERCAAILARSGRS